MSECAAEPAAAADALPAEDTSSVSEALSASADDPEGAAACDEVFTSFAPEPLQGEVHEEFAGGVADPFEEVTPQVAAAILGQGDEAAAQAEPGQLAGAAAEASGLASAETPESPGLLPPPELPPLLPEGGDEPPQPNSPPAPGAVGDFVFLDTDGDGVQGAQEAGVAGVTVRLLGQQGSVVAATQTDASGHYGFADLMPGTYAVEFVAPAGYRFTSKDQGGNDALDSDADLTTGRAVATVLSGQTNNTVDAGLIARPIVAVTAGDADASEVGPDGGAFTFTRTGGAVGQALTVRFAAGGTATAGVDYTGLDVVTGQGSVAFAPGQTSVTVALSPAQDFLTETDETATVSLMADPAYEVGSPSGASVVIHDAAVIGDGVWGDEDADGTRDGNESGLGGVGVYLLDTQGYVLDVDTTDEDGSFAFFAAAGTYSLEFTDPLSRALAAKDQGGDGSDSDADPATRRTASFAVTTGQVKHDLDAGYVVPPEEPPINEPPVAAPDAFRVVRDGMLQVPAGLILANDSDPEGEALTVALAGAPAHGSLTLNPDGSFVYTPGSGYVGPDAFTYRVNDGAQLSGPATVSLTVKADNTPPPGTPDSYEVGHDHVLVVPAEQGVLLNDSDADGDPVWAVVALAPVHGTLDLGFDGSLVYVPHEGYVGPDAFAYALADGSTQVTVPVALDVADAAPIAADDTFSVRASAATAVAAPFGVLFNDADPEGDDFQAQLLVAPLKGSLTLAADGSFVYTPGLAFDGRDSFVYAAGSGPRLSDPATVTLVAGPVAFGDTYVVQHDAAFEVEAIGGVLANDDLAEGPALEAVLVSGPLHGTLALDADGSFVYTPAAEYVGADQFSYRARSGSQVSEVVTVDLEVVDEAPAAPDVTFTLKAGQALADDLGAFASDPDLADALAFVLDAGPAHGALTLGAGGAFVYQPGAGFVGTDTFTYHTDDGPMSSGIGTVTVRVEGDAPVAVDAGYDVAKDGTLAADPARNLLTEAAYDMDGDALTINLVSGPAHAQAFALNADGTFAYTPQAGYTGDDEFTFRVSDGVLFSAAATVVLKVTAAPVAHDDSYRVRPLQSLYVSAERGVLRNDFAAGGSLTAELVAGPSVGTVNLQADGSFTYGTDPGEQLPDAVTFTYRVGNGSAASDPATVTLVVVPPEVTLLRESFSGDVRRVRKDDGSGDYRAGWVAGEGDDPQAFAVVAGGAVRMVVKFAVDRPELLDPELLGVTGTAAALTPDAAPALVLDRIAKTLTATWDEVPVRPYPAVLDGVRQQWTVIPQWATQAGDNLTADGASEYKLYVLPAAPVQGVELFHTVARVAAQVAQRRANILAEQIRHDILAENPQIPPLVFDPLFNLRMAAGITSAAFIDSLKTGAMNEFSRLTIRRADGRAPGKFSDVLTYYGDWAQALKTLTTAGLLAGGDGQCTAWAQFFLDVLNAQGIAAPDKPLRMIVTGTDDLKGRDFSGLLFVKNWGTAPGDEASNRQGQPQAARFPYVNYWRGARRTFMVDMLTFRDDKKDIRDGYAWTPEANKRREKVRKQPGIPGQGGGTNPLAIFGDHVVTVAITINNQDILFDPSYGSRYTGATEDARLLAFQKGSLSFVGQARYNPFGKPATGSVLLEPTKDNNNLRLIAFALTRELKP